MAAVLGFYEVDGLVVASDFPLRAEPGTGVPDLTIRASLEPLANQIDSSRFTAHFPNRPVMAQIGDALMVKVGRLLEAKISAFGHRADVWTDRDLDQPALNELLMGQLVPLAFARRPLTIVLRGEVRSASSGGNVLIASQDTTNEWARVWRHEGMWIVRNAPLVAVIVAADDFGQRRAPLSRVSPAAAVTELVPHSFMIEPSGAIATLLERYGRLVDDVPVFQVRSKREDQAIAIERGLSNLFEHLR